MSTYTTKFFNDRITMEADFGQASSPIIMDGETTGKQVADYRHDPKAAMRDYLEQIVREGGDDPAVYAGEIDRAIAAME